MKRASNLIQGKGLKIENDKIQKQSQLFPKNHIMLQQVVAQLQHEEIKYTEHSQLYELKLSIS